MTFRWSLSRMARLVLLMAVLAPTVLLIHVARPVPVGVAAQAPARAPGAVFVVGRRGDNLRPLAVTVYDNGTVTGFYTRSVTGGVQGHPTGRLSLDTLAGLRTLARAEGFARLPAQIGHPTALQAARFITLTTNARTTTVLAWTSGRAAFNELYAVLLSVAGVPLDAQR